MRIILVCKRYYTGKDVILHRYGRLYELPTQLARLGHQITVLCLDYRNDDRQEIFTEHFDTGLVSWINVSLRHVVGCKLGKIYRRVKSLQPELVIGSSDIPCLWLAKRLAKRFSAAFIIDLYDNYESFGQVRIPGFLRLLKNSIQSAEVVIVVSSALKKKINSDYKPHGTVVVMTNGIVRNSFFPGDRLAARAALRLPANARLIGTAGALSPMKGVDTLYKAWEVLEESTDDVYLVLAGRVWPEFPIPAGDRVLYLGELLEEQVGDLFRALDVGIITAHDSKFGRYCFPQKLFEMIACDLPLAAAKVGAVADTLRASPSILYACGDADSLSDVLKLQLNDPQLADIRPLEWSELVAAIEPVILGLSPESSR